MDFSFPTFRKILKPRDPRQTRSAFLWPWYTTDRQHRDLLRIIAVAIADKLPLVPLLESWSADERGMQQHRIRRLTRLLKEGIPLADAVEQVTGVLRDEGILAIRFGSQSGTLAASLRARLEQTETTGVSPFHAVRRSLIYASTMMLIGLLAVLFTRIKITPAFAQIFNDFSESPPPALQNSMLVVDTIGTYWWLVALFALALLWLAFSSGSGQLVRRTILGRLFRPLADLRAADLLQKLSIANEAGRPIPGALSTLARYHFDPVIRHKLLFVRNEVEQGADAWQSMAIVGLLTPPEKRVLLAADRIGNRPWALAQLAIGKRRKTMLRLERLSDLLLPILVALMGVFVLIQSLTLFLPMVQLITQVLL